MTNSRSEPRPGDAFMARAWVRGCPVSLFVVVDHVVGSTVWARAQDGSLDWVSRSDYHDGVARLQAARGGAK